MSAMYEKLDSLILGHCQEIGGVSIQNLFEKRAGDEAIRIAANTGRSLYRVIEGRLQALRKRGLIRHVGGVWRSA